MKKFVICLFCFAWSLTYAHQCPSELPQDLYDNLKNKINWVDINPIEPFSQSCLFTVRYYPCDRSFSTLLNNTLDYLAPTCTHNHPAPRKVDGYCAINRVKLSCNE